MSGRIDEIIKSCVVNCLSQDSRIKASDIQVEVDQGHVTLKGNALDSVDIQYAGHIVLNMPGVIQVKNDLHTISPGHTSAIAHVLLINVE